MGDFLSSRKQAVLHLLTREPSPAGRVIAVPQILVSVAGAALIVLAPDPTFSPLILAFIGAIVGLFLTGAAEFVPNPAVVYRASLRALGLVLLTPMMAMLLVSAFRAATG